MVYPFWTFPVGMDYILRELAHELHRPANS